jgi:spore germination protein YaaH
MAYMTNEVPKHKIIAGLPTYSVDWDLIQVEQSRQVYDWEWIEARKQEAEGGVHWISYWDVNFLRYRDAEGHPHLLYISDRRSTRSHLVTIDDLDLGGVCFWCLWGDDPGIWQAVREHFRRR